MRNKFTVLLICKIIFLTTQFAFGQSFNLSVNNGYGSGIFQSGDTVTVYCRELLNNETFANWTLSVPVQRVTDDREWWFRFIMPNTNVTATANINPPLPSNFLSFEQIQGRDTLKNVYHSLHYTNKGIVFLFHGGGGQAAGLVGYSNYDEFYIVKQLVQNNYGVIISECEERSINVDTDGSGLFTWQPLPFDSLTNPDYANFIIITDTLRNRGLINPQTPWFTLGGSNGGGFSGFFSYFFNCKAAAIYIASSNAPLMNLTNVPIFFGLMPYDESIGSAGNSSAFVNHNILLDRGICSKYYMNDQMPIYPEYFMRSDGITLSESISVYNDLLINNCVNTKKYLIQSGIQIQSMFVANPQNWAGLNSLDNSKKHQVISLLSVAYGGHKVFSNYCARNISFFDSLCTVTGIDETIDESNISIFPIPSSGIVNIKPNFQGNFLVKFYNSMGQILINQNNLREIDISSFNTGVYFLTINHKKYINTFKVIKQ